jgi:hypothetical protein
VTSKPNDEMTAEELMAQLESDPEWVARRDRREGERRRLAEINRRDAAPVVAELRAAGLEVDSVADLHTRRMNYRHAVPILMRWLPRIDNPAVKEDIVRSLTVEWAKPQAGPLLIDEFRRADDPGEELGLRWAIGNALAEVADDSVFEEVADLASDRSWGRSREMLTVALGNMSDPRAVEVLRGLLQDEQVAGHAVMAVGKLGAREARPDIEPLLDHPRAWVRQKAKEVLAELDTA